MAPRSSQEEAPEEEEAPGHDEFVADLSKFAEDRGYGSIWWTPTIMKANAND